MHAHQHQRASDGEHGARATTHTATGTTVPKNVGLDLPSADVGVGLVGASALVRRRAAAPTARRLLNRLQRTAGNRAVQRLVVQRAPLQFDYDAVRVALPDRGLSLEQVESALKSSLTSYDIGGCQRTSDAYFFVAYFLWQYSQRKRGRESHISIPIAWPKPSAGWDSVTVGQVILQFPTGTGPLGGPGKATLVSSGPTATGTATEALRVKHAAKLPLNADPVIVLKTAIQAEFLSPGEVVDKDRKWTAAELEKVYAALKRLSAKEVGAIKGARLERVAGLSESESEGRESAHWFGRAAAPKLEVADATFVGDQPIFTGSQVTPGHFAGTTPTETVPISMQTLLHELGHAVEDEQVRARQTAAAAVLAKQSDAVTGQSSALAKLGGAQKAYQVANSDYTTADNAFNLAATQLKAKNATETPIYKIVLRIESSVAKFVQTPTGDNQAAAGLVLDKANVDPFKTLVGHARSAVTARAAMESANQEIKRLNALAVKLLAESKELAARYTFEIGEANKEVDNSKRLRAFVEYVKSKNIQPGLTSYAQQTWDAGMPAELYAEAFSLWKLDPTVLRSYSPDLCAYFDTGAHLKEA